MSWVYSAKRFLALMSLRRWAAVWLTLLTAFTLAGCSRAPDENVVRAVVEDRLEVAFSDPLLTISNFRRLGSAPLSSAEDGASRMIVYYNAELTLDRNYQFSDWESLNPVALASLLGAADQGLTGISPDGNVAGDKLLVRGAVTFRQESGDGWVPMHYVPPETSAVVVRNDQTSAPARELIERMMERLAKVPASEVEASQSIIEQEIEEAMHQIDLRLENLQRAVVVAGGPADGEYGIVAQAIADQADQDGAKIAAVSTDGSVQNARLLREGLANIGLVQSDVALMAFQGTGAFEGQGGAPSLRVLGSLFPEPVHIIVRADGPTSIADLRGKRVDLGLPTSGTRITGLEVLRAHGLSESDIEESNLGLAEAANALARGEVDALVTVINSPERHLQRLSADNDVRMLSVSPDVITTLTETYPGVVPITLPAGTYPKQVAPVQTIGVAALLLANAEMANADVRKLLSDVYGTIDFQKVGSAAGSKISLRHAHTGATIPMHSGADVYLEEKH